MLRRFAFAADVANLRHRALHAISGFVVLDRRLDLRGREHPAVAIERREDRAGELRRPVGEPLTQAHPLEDATGQSGDHGAGVPALVELALNSSGPLSAAAWPMVAERAATSARATAALGVAQTEQVLNLVRTDATPELAYRLKEPITTAELLINLRAEAAPGS